ncbi:hypothetical protein L195_g039131 [Trifolium pratense]|uniref:Uncharacterized protein n=1 Tax=Trifolium pratense TaxID=57577 RepID=A0A2K3LX42_TRIPR|nr:hypothetical protein L195_g039131 [Trifolium pratense]
MMEARQITPSENGEFTLGDFTRARAWRVGQGPTTSGTPLQRPNAY